jgi:hypothetical protein
VIEYLNADGTLDPHPTSRARLEQEYVFMGVMSTFLRAIRAGAIHVRHGAILLAHYGRLGPSFDLCSRVIVDSLREEGMFKNNGEVVTTVVTQALREVGACVMLLYRGYSDSFCSRSLCSSMALSEANPTPLHSRNSCLPAL